MKQSLTMNGAGGTHLGEFLELRDNLGGRRL